MSTYVRGSVRCTISPRRDSYCDDTKRTVDVSGERWRKVLDEVREAVRVRLDRAQREFAVCEQRLGGKVQRVRTRLDCSEHDLLVCLVLRRDVLEYSSTLLHRGEN